MLFNPRTENNTYAMIGPFVGLYVAQCYLVWQRNGLAIACAACGLAMLGSYELGRFILPDIPPVWLAPLACSIFTLICITLVLPTAARADERSVILSIGVRPASDASTTQSDTASSIRRPRKAA